MHHARHRQVAEPTQTCRFEAVRDAPGTAREFVSSVLAGWRRQHLSEAAELIVSEFVTRSITAGSGGTILLHCGDDGVHLEVTADRADFYDAEQASLATTLISAVSGDWGVSYTWPRYRAIWSDLAD